MDKIITILQRKSSGIVLLHLVYFLLIGFLKWRFAPSIPTLLFFTGAVLGIYLLNIAEAFFGLAPSPFRSIVFVAGFVLVSLFVITSTGSMLGIGLILSLYITLIVWQLAEWQEKGNLNRWYSMIAGSLPFDTQRLILGGFIVLFVIETFLFLR